MKLIVKVFFTFFMIKRILCGGYDESKTKTITGFNDYGPYYVTTQSLENCVPSVPWAKNKLVTVDIKVVKTSRTNEDFQGNVTFDDDVIIRGGLIKTDVWQDGGFKPVVLRKVSNSCTSIALMTALNSFVKPDANCMVKKGLYKVKNINPNDVVHKITSNLQYSKYAYTLEWYAKEGAMVCIKMVCEVKPLRPKKPKH